MSEQRYLIAAIVLISLLGLISTTVVYLGAGDASASEARSTSSPASPLQLHHAKVARDSLPHDLFLSSRTESGVTIAGVVRRSDGGSTAEATVVLEDTWRIFAPLRVQPDEQGRFRFGPLPMLNGNYRIIASLAGFAPTHTTTWGAQSRSDLELMLRPCERFVHGLITDASGGPIAGARVHTEQAASAGVQTDDLGAYRLCVGKGALRLVVEAEDYGTWSTELDRGSAGKTDAQLAPSGSIEGVVRARGGKPVPGAFVTLMENWHDRSHTLSDAEGRFRFANLSPGPYMLGAWKTGGALKQPVTVHVLAGQSSSTELELDPRVRVRGQVISGRRPVPDIWINLGFRGSREASRWVHTNADGHFEILDAPMGPTVVSVSRGFEVLEPLTLQVPPNGLDNVVVQVAKRAAITVRVVRDDKPVAGAEASVSSDQHWRSALTNDQGDAEISGLDPGLYRVSASADGDFGVADTVKIAAGQRSSLTIEIKSSATVTGDVRDEKGTPMNGANVRFVPESRLLVENVVTTTDDAGAFSGGPLPGPQSYHVEVRSSGQRLDLKTTATVTVDSQRDVHPAHLNITVKRPVHILEGSVFSGGTPGADINVQLQGADKNEVRTTGQDGLFRFDGLSSGPFTLRAISSDNAMTKRENIVLPSPPIRLDLPETATVRGRLEGFARAPSVMAWPIDGYDGETIYLARVTGEQFEISGLSDGHYLASAALDDSAATTSFQVPMPDGQDLLLRASGSRNIDGRLVDIESGAPIAGSECTAAPDNQGARSPVVVPGSVFTDQDGRFRLTAVPASALYMWCNATPHARGGAQRLPADLDGEAIVFGLITDGRAAIHPDASGFSLNDHFPMSRSVLEVFKNGAAARAGLRVSDVIVEVDGKALHQVSNGLVRAYVAWRIASTKTATLLVERAGHTVSLQLK